jgi:hypothetical protein
MARVEAAGIEDQIVKAIVSERAEYHACTARQLSRRLGFHHSYISEVLQRMKAKGIVDFIVEIPGSIHLAGTVEAHWVDYEPEDAEAYRKLEEYTVDAPVMPAKSRKEIRLGVNAERMAARMAAKKEAREALAAVEAAALKPRVKKVPGTKKAAAPRKGTAAS